MKKRRIVSVLALSLVLSMTGCGAGSENMEYGIPDYSEYLTLGEYKNLEVEVEQIDITDEAVAEEVQATLDDEKTTEIVEDHTDVRSGDIVNINYAGTVDGDAFDGGTFDDEAGYDLTIGSNGFIPGFEDGLIGHEVGEEVVLDLTFPETYSQTPELAGQAVQFTVNINHISKEVVPELTDEFVATISEYATVDEYKASVREKLETSAEESMASSLQGKALSTVIEQSEITSYPEETVETYKESFTSYYTAMAKNYSITLEELLSQSFGATMEDFDEQATSYAQSLVESEMVLMSVAKAEGIALTKAEYEEGLAKLVEDYQYESAETLLESTTKDDIIKTLLLDKVLKFLGDSAHVTYTTADAADTTDAADTADTAISAEPAATEK